MSTKKPKFYVVWRGVHPGVYTTWEDASRQVQGFAGAIFKSFPSRAEAESAFHGAQPVYRKHITSESPPVRSRSTKDAEYDLDALAVDAACSGPPGPMEYRGVWVRTGEEVFHRGPYEDGTNNIGEFLAIVHAAAWLKRQERPEVIIYLDSENAIKWIAAKVCRTKLEPTSRNGETFELIARALKWLKENTIENQVSKWETGDWGENPADFGRK